MHKIERIFKKESKIDKQKSCFQHNGKRFYNPIADEKLGRLNNSGLNERKQNNHQSSNLCYNYIGVNASTITDIKIAIKQLKLLKKGYTQQKQQVVLQQKIIRAKYTNYVRTRGPMMRGGGFGKFIRAIQAISRAGKSSELAQELAPLEKRKHEIEAIIQNIGSKIIDLEARLIRF